MSRCHFRNKKQLIYIVKYFLVAIVQSGYSRAKCYPLIQYIYFIHLRTQSLNEKASKCHTITHTENMLLFFLSGSNCT